MRREHLGGHVEMRNIKMNLKEIRVRHSQLDSLDSRKSPVMQESCEQSMKFPAA
jgi:hypothetical protein